LSDSALLQVVVGVETLEGQVAAAHLVEDLVLLVAADALRLTQLARVVLEAGVAHTRTLLSAVQTGRLLSARRHAAFFAVRSVRHGEERVRAAHEFVDVPLARHFLHDAFFVVVAQGAAQFVVVHGGPVLLHTPSPCNLEIKHNICVLFSDFRQVSAIF